MLYLGQIAYGSKLISKTKKTTPETSQNGLANFVSLCTAKSHKYIVWVFYMFSFNIDNEEANKPASLKEAMIQ